MMSTSRVAAYIPLVQRLAARMVLFHSAIAARSGLNATDLTCLRLLDEEPMTAGAISDQVGLTGSSVTAMIDRLEKAGYVVRERDAEDRRRITVRMVTEKVVDIDALYDSQRARMSKLLSKYSANDFAVIADFIEHTTSILTEEALKLKNGEPAHVDDNRVSTAVRRGNRQAKQ
jgi:DNA-binding MarR family transcriptional regulator